MNSLRTNEKQAEDAQGIPRHARTQAHATKAMEHLTFAIGTCSLGALMVARNAGGVCAILLGDTRADVLDELQQRFPHAAIVEGDHRAIRLLSKVAAIVESPKTALDLPLDSESQGEGLG